MEAILILSQLGSISVTVFFLWILIYSTLVMKRRFYTD